MQKLLAQLLEKYAQCALYVICETSPGISKDAQKLKEEIETLANKINIDTPDIDWNIYILNNEFDIDYPS